MRNAIIFGSGGHCRAILDTLFTCNSHRVLGILDVEFLDTRAESILGVNIIGGPDDLNKYRTNKSIDLFLALGGNRMREQWWGKSSELGINMPNLISPFACISRNAEIGISNTFLSNAYIGPNAKIGKNCLFNTSCILEHEVLVGDHCHLAPGAIVCGKAELKNGVFMGARSIAIDGVTIAPWVVIGAGGVVNKSVIDENSIYVGSPAKKMNKSKFNV